MSQRQTVLFGDVIDDNIINRMPGTPAGVYEGFEPTISGLGGTAGWILTLGTSPRGISVWRTAGDPSDGRVTVDENGPVTLHIAPPDAMPRIDLVIGIHKRFEGPLDPATGRPTGVMTPAQRAMYTIVQGTPASEPLAPDIPSPWDVDGREAVVLAAIRVTSVTENRAWAERWDPTDWTHERRGLPHLLNWNATNPNPGINVQAYTFGDVTATSPLWSFDFDQPSIQVVRSGWAHVLVHAEDPTKLIRLGRRSLGEAVYTDIASANGTMVENLFLKGGDCLVIGGDSSAQIRGQFIYLGFSDQEVELQDLSAVFTITNVDVEMYGEEAFPKAINIPITYAGATPPIEWRILPGSDLPSASISGDSIDAILQSYGGWTVKLYGRDSVGFTGRKTFRVLQFPGQLLITNPAKSVLGSNDGQPWSDADGVDYGHTGATGFTRTFGITKTGGVEPFQFAGREGSNLLNPWVNSVSGASTLWIAAKDPTDANYVSGQPAYIGETTVTLQVSGGFGSSDARNVTFYAPRIHATYGGRFYQRQTATTLVVPRQASPALLVSMATGTPTQPEFGAGSHNWEIDGGATSLPAVSLTGGTGATNGITAPWPAADGSYTVRLRANVVVGTQSVWTNETFTLSVVPHGSTGLSWVWSSPYDGASKITPHDHIFYFNGKWRVWGSSSVGNRIFTSADGLVWTGEIPSGITIGSFNLFITAVRPDKAEVMVARFNGYTGAAARSMDGINWTPVANLPEWGVSYWYLGGSWYYQDRFGSIRRLVGNTWAVTAVATLPRKYQVAGFNGTTVVLSKPYAEAEEGTVAVSTDCVNWSYATVPDLVSTIFALTGGAGGITACIEWIGDKWLLFLATGASRTNDVYWTGSADGLTWTKRTLPVPVYLTDFCFSWNGTLGVLVEQWTTSGRKLRYLTTLDGISWQSRTIDRPPSVLTDNLGARRGIANNGFDFCFITDGGTEPFYSCVSY